MVMSVDVDNDNDGNDHREWKPDVIVNGQCHYPDDNNDDDDDDVRLGLQ